MSIVVLASGSGSNFEAIVKASKLGEIKSSVDLLITDQKKAKVIKRAQDLKIRYEIVSLSEFETKQMYEKKIISLIKEINPDLICLAGYMKIVSEDFLEAYEGKIINIHPSLLPKYPGNKAFEEAYENNEKKIGVTVHFVNEFIDDGEIIKQVEFNIEGLSKAQAQEKLHKYEHKLYVDVIKQMEENYEKSID